MPLYQDSIEKELAYIVDHAEARFAVVEDQEQVDKLLHVRAQCPRLEFIVYDDARGLRGYSRAEPAEPRAELQERGRKFELGHPGYFEDEVAPRAGGRHRDHLLHLGDHRRAQGRDALAPEPHRYRAQRRGDARASGATRRSCPTCRWRGSATTCFSYAQSIVTGFAINCPESAATVLHDLKEIGPTYFFAPPRIWESLLTSVLMRIEDCAWPKRTAGALLPRPGPGPRAATARRRQPVPLLPRLLSPLGRVLVYGPLRDNLGMRRVRRAYTAGEAIGPEIFVFFRALGINVKQLYGMTEASVFVTIQRDGDVRLDTVGTADPGRRDQDLRDGRGAVPEPRRLPGLLQEPGGDPARRCEDGWLHSGDAGLPRRRPGT